MKKAAWINHQSGGSTAAKSKESKWLKFVPIDPLQPRKTKIWGVCTKGSKLRPEEKLGEVYWFGAWRKYVFYPDDAVFESTCLRDIADFCEMKTQEHYRNAKLP